MAEKMYLFMSRDEINGLKSLGLIGPQLTNIVAREIKKLHITLKTQVWDKKSKMRANLGKKSMAFGQSLLGKQKGLQQVN